MRGVAAADIFELSVEAANIFEHGAEAAAIFEQSVQAANIHELTISAAHDVAPSVAPGTPSGMSSKHVLGGETQALR